MWARHGYHESLETPFPHTTVVLLVRDEGSRGGCVWEWAFEDQNLKRFTDTQKWDDPWFWELSPTAKLLWSYLLDHCDNAGAVEFNAKIAGFKIGQPVKPEHLTELGTRLKTLKSGKLWIPKFIRFQFGPLEPTNNLHRSVLKLLSAHRLRYPEDVDLSTPDSPLTTPSHTPYGGSKYGKGMERVKEKEEGVQGEKPRIKDSTVIPDLLACSPEFLDVWGRWLSHLKQKRKPATLHAQDLQLAKLLNMGAPKAIETLRHCMERNWQGIYEKVPEHSGNGSETKPLTMYELQAKLKVKQDRATAFKNKHCSPVAMGDVWDSDASKAEYVAIRGEIKTLNQQVENYASH